MVFFDVPDRTVAKPSVFCGVTLISEKHPNGFVLMISLNVTPVFLSGRLSSSLVLHTVRNFRIAFSNLVHLLDTD